VELSTTAIEVRNGLSTYMPSEGLKSVLDRGETPAEPSFRQWRKEVAILEAQAGSGDDVTKSYDTYENTHWTSAGKRDSAWVTYTLCEKTRIDDICIKMKDFRSTTYPIAVYADDTKVWEGWTPKSLSYVHIPLKDAPAAQHYTIRMTGESTTKDAFGMVKEMDKRNDEKRAAGGRSLKIIEIEFLKNL